MWTTRQLPKLTGKTYLVTGANTGIGYKTASALYQAGADVVLACRSLDRAKQAQLAMQQAGGTGTLEVAHLDLVSLGQVHDFAAAFRDHHCFTSPQPLATAAATRSLLAVGGGGKVPFRRLCRSRL